MSELSLGILEGHKLVANPVKIYNKQMIPSCCCVSCAAASRVKVQYTVEGDREISRGSKPAKKLACKLTDLDISFNDFNSFITNITKTSARHQRQ